MLGSEESVGLPAQLPDLASRRQKPYFLLCGFLTLAAIALAIYSQTQAFTWDEGFHLLTAQLIDRGKRPYIDFCFPQTPLNAYWNAAWMHVFGQSWRVSHVFATLLSIAAVFLIADFLYLRFPVAKWRFAVALGGGLMFGLNELVFGFGTVGQAYAMCLFLTVVAFRTTMIAARRTAWVWPAASGLFASGAAAASLLSALAWPVLLAWMLVYNQIGSRWAKLVTFVAASVVPFAPVLWLYTLGPKQTVFNVLTYQALFRRVHWEGATEHDIEALSAWIDSSQGLILVLLGLAGLLFLRKIDWERKTKSEFYLAAWLGVTMTAYLSTPHPTFTRYFVVAIPFIAVVASVGFYAIGVRLASPDRPRLAVIVLAVLISLGLAKSIYNEIDSYTWTDFEAIARKVDQVTPPNGSLYSNELVYFMTKRPPPFGMEFSYAHKLELPKTEEQLLHVISQRQLDQEIKAGIYQTLVECDDDRIGELKLNQLYSSKQEIAECTVFWNLKKP